MNRRAFLATAASAAAASAASAPPRSQMGIATTSYMTAGRPRDMYAYLEYCHGLGAGGVQLALPPNDAELPTKLRTRAEQLGMYVEVMVGLPRKDDGVFERSVAAAKQAGALCVRSACLGGRRYETFNSLRDWQTFITESRAALDRAVPILEKHRIPMTLENHKDWTVDEMVALLKDKSSEYLGACIDTGNNISLLDDPMEVIERLGPFAHSTHLKDMGVELYGNGFLLSEMPLGEGFLDTKKIVNTIRAARPKTRITLEMITRDPLQVPCLTDKYWVTFPERNGRYLARALALVREKARGRLPRVSGLNHEAQVRLEEDNVKQCLFYAREQLGL